MAPPSSTRTNTTPHLSTSLLALATDCSASGDTLNCHLNNVLHLLYLAAGILTLAALIVLILAIRTYLKNRIPDPIPPRNPDKRTRP